MARFTASTLEQAQAGGGIGFVINAIDQYGRTAAAAYIREAFPDMGNAEIRRVLNYGERAVQVANEFELGQGDRVAPRREIPVNPLLSSDCEFLYRFQGSWTDAGGQRRQLNSVDVCSNSSLTYNEALAAAQDQFLEQATGDSGPGQQNLPGSIDEVSFDLVSIQRRG